MVFLLFTCSWTHATPNVSFSSIRHLYVEGEFEQLRMDLEDFLRKSGKSARPKERMFAYKYLGVVYAAEPEGYPIAETYFYRLLTLAPKAHLSDLYVSSAVESLFQKTRERFQKEHRDNIELDGFGNPRKESEAEGALVQTPGKTADPDTPRQPPVKKPTSTNPKARKKKSGILLWPYIAGIGVAGVLGGYYWHASRDKPDNEVDARLPNTR